ncbi:sugar transporter SWEET1-like [Rhynchophorus ferrugineus]|uniref:sugar transporter SWEET1-like n=1 Tax=Rhynchophorus ferrugineus TaxID=354439 RepID=UPI003FCD6ACD
MESISQILQPYRDIVGEVASYVTIAQFFSGILLCRDIYKKGSTKGFVATPFIGGLTLGVLMLKYGLLLSDPASIKVNLVAIVLNILYLLVFYQYNNNRTQDVLKPLGYATTVVAVLLGYAEVESPDKIEFRFGLIVNGFLLALIAFPLFGVREIIAKRDASSIPVLMTFMSTLVTFMWLLYGIILRNTLMVIPNIIGLLLCTVQFTLLALYGSKPPSKSGKNKKKKNKKE